MGLRRHTFSMSCSDKDRQLFYTVDRMYYESKLLPVYELKCFTKYQQQTISY